MDRIAKPISEDQKNHLNRLVDGYVNWQLAMECINQEISEVLGICVDGAVDALNESDSLQELLDFFGVEVMEGSERKKPICCCHATIVSIDGEDWLTSFSREYHGQTVKNSAFALALEFCQKFHGAIGEKLYTGGVVFGVRVHYEDGVEPALCDVKVSLGAEWVNPREGVDDEAK